ncbi:hypothetical protein KIN20_026952 [Parelaphostrongylus tenuis]|uniref:CAP-Gly domain-containing protein n=1 Tax=Parelaphostrongylus tenuis TaxID=148309 RepID=A0AAD5WDA3_PARTN|nr:hypothetical protein KIN20_026952 [Parelaphostrongylus tenuis]
MTEVYALEITSNASEFSYEKKFPSSITLGELKKKLELVVGAVSESIRVELHDDQGKFVASLTDTSKTLKELGVRDGMHIHAIDVSGGNVELQDDSMVEKYTISDDKYNERRDTARAWKKKLLAQNAGDQKHAATMESNYKASERIKVGDRCEVQLRGCMPRRGIVSFIGETKFREGIWVGVTYDEPAGKNDGAVDGVRYFQCNDKHGGFVRPVDVVVGDFPTVAK